MARIVAISLGGTAGDFRPTRDGREEQYQKREREREREKLGLEFERRRSTTFDRIPIEIDAHEIPVIIITITTIILFFGLFLFPRSSSSSLQLAPLHIGGIGADWVNGALPLGANMRIDGRKQKRKGVNGTIRKSRTRRGNWGNGEK